MKTKAAKSGPRKTRTIPKEKRGDKSFLAVAEKMFQTLEIFTVYREGALSLDEVTRKTGLPKSTAFRLLSSLEKCGYLQQDKISGRYSLGARFFDLASSPLPYSRLISIVRPYLNSLMLTFAESVNLGVYDDGLVATIFTIDSPQSHRVSATVGNRAHLHCTSLGKALAAYMEPGTLHQTFLRYGLPPKTSRTFTSEPDLFAEMDSIRASGISHDNQEDVEGVECFGAAVFGPDGRPAAAISVSGPAIRIGLKAESIQTAVRQTARRISFALGWDPAAPSPPRL